MSPFNAPWDEGVLGISMSRVQNHSRQDVRSSDLSTPLTLEDTKQTWSTECQRKFYFQCLLTFTPRTCIHPPLRRTTRGDGLDLSSQVMTICMRDLKTPPQAGEEGGRRTFACSSSWAGLTLCYFCPAHSRFSVVSPYAIKERHPDSGEVTSHYTRNHYSHAQTCAITLINLASFSQEYITHMM